MDLVLKNAILSFAIFWLYLLDCSFELNRRVVLISLERPLVPYLNHEVARVLNITSRRPGRSDPIHYVHLCVQYLRPFGNSTEITIKVSEFLSNEYRPTFVELKFKFCDFISQFMNILSIFYTSDASVPFTRVDLQSKCYLKKGFYCYANMSLPLSSLPENFPFEKGRAFVNHTHKGKLVMGGFIDLELKTLPLRKYRGQP